MSYTYAYPRPSVTVDGLVLFQDCNATQILLIKRKNPPFPDKWAFPGGFIEMNEDLADSCLREVEEETGIALKKVNQFKTFGTPGRDPRGRTISVVFYTFIENLMDAKANDDASEAKWFSIEQLPPLAFDHDIIIQEFISTHLNRTSI